MRRHEGAMLDSQDEGVYFGKVFNSGSNSQMGAIMALEAVEAAETVAADDFRALEEKIYRTIEMYKAARAAQVTAERDAARMRQQLEEREEQLVALKRESVQLRKEREEIRGRVEKMLEQIDSLAEAS